MTEQERKDGKFGFNPEDFEDDDELFFDVRS